MMTRQRARRSGQATVGFAMVATVLLLLTMGIVDFSRGIWTYNTLAYLAREGARYAAVPSRTNSQIRSYVISRAALPDLSTGAVFIDARGTCGDVNDPAVIRMRYPFTAASLFISSLWGGGPLFLEAVSTMYVERGIAGVHCACGGTC